MLTNQRDSSCVKNFDVNFYEDLPVATKYSQRSRASPLFISNLEQGQQQVDDLFIRYKNFFRYTKMVKLTKSYLRYEPAGQFGTIASPNCNCLLSGDGKYVFSAANEFVVCWSLRRNEAVFQFSPSSNFLGNGGQSSTTSSGKSKTSSSSDKQLASAAASGDAAVTRLAWLNDRPGATMLVGHTDGTLRIWDFSLNTKAEIDKGFDVFDLKPPALRQVLHGHKAAITTIGCVSSPPPQSVASSSSAEASEQLVATGSADTDIVLWDVLGERGVCRLRGHRDRVTGLQFVAGPLTPLGKGRLLSVSKDKTLKLWELETQICLQTVAERVELWSCLYWQGTSSGGGAGAASTSAARVVVGGTDHLLRVYSVNAEETEDVDRLQQIGTLQREIANAAAVELLRGKMLARNSSLQSGPDHEHEKCTTSTDGWSYSI